MAADLKYITATYIHNKKIPYTPETLVCDCIDLVGDINSLNRIRIAIRKGIGNENIKYLFEKTQWNDCSDGVYNATITGNRDLIDFFIEKNAGIKSLDFGFYMGIAAEFGHYDIVNFFINEKGADDWNWGLHATIKGYHIAPHTNPLERRKFVDFFIEKGANLGIGMVVATKYGYRELVELFAKGADNYQSCMEIAAQYGYTELVEFFRQKLI